MFYVQPCTGTPHSVLRHPVASLSHRCHGSCCGMLESSQAAVSRFCNIFKSDLQSFIFSLSVFFFYFIKLKIFRSLWFSGWSSKARCRNTSFSRAALCHDIVMLLGAGVGRRSVIIRHLFPLFQFIYSHGCLLVSRGLDPAAHLTRQGIGCSGAIRDSDGDDGMVSVIDGFFALLCLFCGMRLGVVASMAKVAVPLGTV